MFTAEHTNNVFWLAPFFVMRHIALGVWLMLVFFSFTLSFRFLSRGFVSIHYPLSLANLVLPSLMMSGCRRSGQTIWLQWYWIWLDYLCLLCLSFLMRRACECNGLISTRRQPISGATLVIIPQAYDANGFFAMCSMIGTEHQICIRMEWCVYIRLRTIKPISLFLIQTNIIF